MLVRPHIQIMMPAIDCRWDREFSCAYASKHQLATTGKQPRPDWADRAFIALLLGLVPKARRADCVCSSPRIPSCAGTATLRLPKTSSAQVISVRA